MRRMRCLSCLMLAILCAAPAGAQRVIPLYAGPAPGSESWTQQEIVSPSSAWGGTLVSNVTRPSLTMYPAATDKATGTAVVICPGGGFYALAFENEGTAAAAWLAARGVTAFVLKYRLAKTGADPVAEFGAAMRTPGVFEATTRDIIPLAIRDGMAAVAYVRSHSAELGVNADRVGIMGFSAGGTIAAAVAFQYAAESRPAFIVPVYAYAPASLIGNVPADAPPMFIAAATDDDLGLAPQSVALYSRWIAAKMPAELHLYERGGHGFGMRSKGVPTDGWIERFADWLTLQGLMKK